AGLVPAALGSDGAGSVRIPASWTNLVGIKPQRGRISTWPSAELFNGLTVHGTLARTVADAALLFDVAAGAHPGDRHTPPAATVSDAVGRDPGRLKIALALNIPFTATRTALDREVAARVQDVAGALRRLDHEVTVAELPYGLLSGVSFLSRSMAGIRSELAKLTGAQVDPRTRFNAKVGLLLGGP
ncbi:amidase family protein, partial [Nocardia gipuzkoensis]